MTDTPSFADARRVRDYVVGFRYRARLFRPPPVSDPASAFRFALSVTDGSATTATANDEPPILVVTAEGEPGDDVNALMVHVGGRHEAQGVFADIRDIDGFLERAADLVCEHLAVDRGTFRPIPGSEPPAPWETRDPNTSPCRACGSPLAADDDHCGSCGALAE